jgi:hypothetical protein
MTTKQKNQVYAKVLAYAISKNSKNLKEQFLEYCAVIQLFMPEITISDGERFFEKKLEKVMSVIMEGEEVQDRRPYHLNGFEAGKGRIVLQLVKQYLQDHPGAKFNQLKSIFTDEILNTGKLTFLEEENKVSKLDRYFSKENEVLTSGDGVRFMVCTQWGSANFPDVIELAADLGYSITPAA